MPRKQCGNQLGAEQLRETSKLIAIIDDDDALQESLRDLMEGLDWSHGALDPQKNFSHQIFTTKRPA